MNYKRFYKRKKKKWERDIDIKVYVGDNVRKDWLVRNVGWNG